MAKIRGNERTINIVFADAEIHFDNGIDEIENIGKLQPHTKDCILNVMDELLIAEGLTEEEKEVAQEMHYCLKILIQHDTKEKRYSYIQGLNAHRVAI